MQQRKAKQEGSPEAIKLASRTLALHDDKPTLPETNVKQINLRLTAPDEISEVEVTKSRDFKMLNPQWTHKNQGKEMRLILKSK